ncbi:MAG: SET domain-containing protein-lysine N-methyltransferase [Thalassobius sp.]|nr:SET domain-containing protein-lysine N-methyltransferase [Thalassovita sp.]
MIHPNTELRFINDAVGLGIFAKTFIPEGTIVYVKDSLEIEISPEDYAKHSDQMKDVIEKYSYIDQRGVHIISWDHAKYVNHCCNCNTISTAYGFEIAIRDIFPGEEITDEYGLFNIKQEIPLLCNNAHCRKMVRPEDFDNYYPQWDEKIKKSLTGSDKLPQPLYHLIDEDTKKELELFYLAPENYQSVYRLKLQLNHVSIH